MTTAHTSAAAEAGSATQRDRRRRILDAADRLAAEGGFEAVQMRAVAQRAEVALGTLYRYFPSKVHLLVSALHRKLATTVEPILDAEVPGEGAADRVIEVLALLSGDLRAAPRLAEAHARAFVFADSSVGTEVQAVGGTVTAVLAHALCGGPADAAGPPEQDLAIVQVIGDLWFSALVGWVTGRSTTAETTARLETAVRLVLHD